MKPFHITRQTGYFGDDRNIWVAKHQYSPHVAFARTPSQALEGLRAILRAKRKRSSLALAKQGYSARCQQEHSHLKVFNRRILA